MSIEVESKDDLKTYLEPAHGDGYAFPFGIAVHIPSEMWDTRNLEDIVHHINNASMSQLMKMPDIVRIEIKGAKNAGEGGKAGREVSPSGA